MDFLRTKDSPFALTTTPFLWAMLAVAVGAMGAIIATKGAAGSAAVIFMAVVALSFWRFEAGLIALVFTLPLGVYGRVQVPAFTLTVFQLTLIVVIVAWIWRIIGSPREWLRFSAMDLGIGALVAAVLWSLPNSQSTGETVFALIRIVFLWVFTLMYANGIRNNAQLRRFFGFFSASAAMMAILGLAQQYVPGFSLGNTHIQKSGLSGGSLSRAAGLFSDPNLLGSFLSVGMVTAFAFLVHSHSKKRAFLWAALTAVTGLGIIATYSRTAMVGAFVGVVVVALTAPRRLRLRLVSVGVVLGLVIVLVAPGAFVSRVESIFDVRTDRSNATRYGMVFSTFQMIEDDWVWGTGLGAYDKVYPAYRQPGTHLDIIEPHQLPLAMWAEMGIAGLLAEIALIVSAASLFIRKRPDGWTVFEVAALGGLLALLAQTFFQYYLYFEYVWLFVALSVVSTRLARVSEEVEIA